MSLEITYSPRVPGGGAACYKLWRVFTYNNGYWEVYSRFQGTFFRFGGGVEGRGLRGRMFRKHSKTIITMSLGMTYSPIISGGGTASYKLWPVFTYNNGYWEVYRRFQGAFLVWGVGLRGRGYVGGSFFREICHGGSRNSMKRAQDFLKLL